MHLNFVKNISLGLVLTILLVVASFAIVSLRSQSHELSQVVEVHIPLREKILQSKELLLQANILFAQYTTLARTDNDEVLPVLHRLQNYVKKAFPETQVSPKVIRINSILQEMEKLLLQVIEEVKDTEAGEGKRKLSLYEIEIQQQFSALRDSLHFLADYMEVSKSLPTPANDHFLVISRLLNLLEDEAKKLLSRRVLSIREVLAPLELCTANIRELDNMSGDEQFGTVNQTLIKELIAALYSYKAAVFLFEDEVNLDVSGENLEEITALVHNAELEAERILVILSYSLLERIDTIQFKAIASIERLQVLYTLLSLMAVCSTVVLFFWFSLFLDRRFAKLVKGAESIGQGVLDFRFGDLAQHRDHFGRLAVVFNSMASALEKRETKLTENVDAIARAQKLEAIGSLAGGIAHDFNNILTAIMGYADLLMMKGKKENYDIEKDVNVIQNSSRRAKDLVKQLLAFSRESENKIEPLALGPIVSDTVELLKGITPATVNISFQIEDECSVLADSSQIYQVLTNLGTNAMQAMETTNGRLDFRLEKVHLAADDLLPYPDRHAGNYARITVHDTGAGIAPEHLGKIYDPYFTTKEFGGGTGLGLFVVFGIIQKHGGIIEVESKPDQGTTFVIYLPLIDTISTTSVDRQDPDGPFAGGDETLLFVDDEENIRTLGKRILEQYGYKVITAENGQNALHRFQQNPFAFDLLITDQTMPRMTGIELVEKVLQLNPDIPIIMITGYSEHVPKARATDVGVKEYVMKPFDKRILRVVRQVLDRGSDS